ncbi:RNA polymerase sigma-54 factor [Nitrospira sp.]|nr:RNA polymerase sigma-54 factor [Nitrospira sp.]
MKLRLDLRLSQKLIMTPQLQQAIKLLQLSRLELQQTLEQHLLDNPLLEEAQTEIEEADEARESESPTEALTATSPTSTEAELPAPADDRTNAEELSAAGWEDYFDQDRRAGDVEYPGSAQDDMPSFEQTLTTAKSLEEHLVWQLSLSTLDDRQKALARLIIGNLEEDGYLRTTLEEVIAGTDFTVEEAEQALQEVQKLDPAGVGARDLPECLLLQLGYLGKGPMGSVGARPGALRGSVVEAVIKHHLKDLEKKQYAKIAKTLDVTCEEVFQATKVIESLEPKPGRPFSSSDNHVIVPDVFVARHEGEWVVLLNDDGLPRMRISPYYKQLMGGQSTTGETKAYLDEKLRAAQWVLRSIEQRNKTIVKVVASIVKFQQAFFDHGVVALRPLVLKQVADDVGMHESTISRVTANKYVYCPQGMFELKYFFNAGLQRADQQGEMLSSVTVREMIRKMVAEEDSAHPLKDEEIADRLRRQHILIARRTVAKYRAEENIPSASQRRRFF